MWSALLGVLVVAAAGLSGTTHFAGPRWLPNLKVPRHTPVLVKPPHQSTVTAPQPPGQHGASSFPLGQLLLWIVVGIAAVGVAVLLWRWWVNRPSRAATARRPVVAMATSEVPVQPEPEPDTPALRTGIELALQVLDEQREPADAIVRAWLGLQETAEESGIVRRPAETPTEFTSRILGHAFTDDRAIRTLLRLYLQTRFGDHRATADDVAAVRSALQELVRTWRAPEAGAGAR
jgi:Domain of unknown function (DUF4129)